MSTSPTATRTADVITATETPTSGRIYSRRMTLYAFVGGPRDGETITQDAEPISSWTTLHGRYVADHPEQLMMTSDGVAVILRFASHIAR